MSNLSEILEFPHELLKDMNIICVKKFESIFSMIFNKKNIKNNDIKII